LSSCPVIIATGGANLASLIFALKRLGNEPVVSEDPKVIKMASHIILPGVGAARDAMSRLKATNLTSLIPNLKQPVLGICLGLQLLYSGSEEDNATCLNIIPGYASRFPKKTGLPVPQMGWNSLTNVKRTPLMNGVRDGDYAYFIHSYALPINEHTYVTANYGESFSAVVQYNNFYATQFHPERSSSVGSLILSNFLNI
jgi:glutamine amidotransferase|tara:strand:+ start:2010 stop:2606 length:597 start_codon:yes stop_codon:yes gene_type:complete